MTGKARHSSSPQSLTTARQRGARIHLRELDHDDAAAFVAAAGASRRLYHPWVQPPLTIAEFVSRMQKRRVASNSLSLLALRSTDNALVGIFNLSEIIRGAGRWRDHERWAINADDWQRGPATGAARGG